MSVDIVGYDELLKYIDDFEKLPQRAVTKIAKGGADIAKQAAKDKAPYLTGALESGIVLKGEKSRTKGKKVFDIKMEPGMSDIFVKETRDGTRYYYPASQEYGFDTKGGGRVHGLYFMKRAATDNNQAIEGKIVRAAMSEIDKIK